MLLKVFFLIILIVINGIFSATEIAFLSLNKYELSIQMKNENKKAKKIFNLLNDSSTFLSSIQIIITLSGFLASAFAAESFASELSEIFNISFLTTEVLIIIITLILSYFNLVFGELIPKKIGLSYSEKIAYGMVIPLEIIIVVFKPFIFILKNSVDLFSKLFKTNKRELKDEDSIKDNILDSSLEELEKKLLLNVFEFNDIVVKDVMTKLEDVVSVDIDMEKDQLFNILKKYKYTRYPVIKEDKIIGLLNVKDFIIKKSEDFKLSDYVRNICEINSKEIIDDAYLFLNSKHEVMAIVKDKNKIVGIVTLEDIIEELIGNVFDEYN